MWIWRWVGDFVCSKHVSSLQTPSNHLWFRIFIGQWARSSSTSHYRRHTENVILNFAISPLPLDTLLCALLPCFVRSNSCENFHILSQVKWIFRAYLICKLLCHSGFHHNALTVGHSPLTHAWNCTQIHTHLLMGRLKWFSCCKHLWRRNLLFMLSFCACIEIVPKECSSPEPFIKLRQFQLAPNSKETLLRHRQSIYSACLWVYQWIYRSLAAKQTNHRVWWRDSRIKSR